MKKKKTKKVLPPNEKEFPLKSENYEVL